MAKSFTVIDINNESEVFISGFVGPQDIVDMEDILDEMYALPSSMDVLVKFNHYVKNEHTDKVEEMDEELLEDTMEYFDYLLDGGFLKNLKTIVWKTKGFMDDDYDIIEEE